MKPFNVELNTRVRACVLAQKNVLYILLNSRGFFSNFLKIFLVV